MIPLDQGFRGIGPSTTLKLLHSAMQSRIHAVKPLFDMPPEDVLVFRTSVENNDQVHALRPMLDELIASGGRWSFDLEDRDRILRVVTDAQVKEPLMALLRRHGHTCVELL